MGTPPGAGGAGQGLLKGAVTRVSPSSWHLATTVNGGRGTPPKRTGQGQPSPLSWSQCLRLVNIALKSGFPCVTLGRALLPASLGLGFSSLPGMAKGGGSGSDFFFFCSESSG